MSDIRSPPSPSPDDSFTQVQTPEAAIEAFGTSNTQPSRATSSQTEAINDELRKLSKLLQAMDERSSQTFLALQRLLTDQHQALTALTQRNSDADTMLKPLQPIDKHASSVWNALRNTAYGHIAPKIDQWKATLDTLLIFIALFSAVVTAFFIESSRALKVDEAKRTNDLLVNLTDIILIVNGVSFPSLGLPTAQKFVPEPQAIRVNSYLFISLVFSVVLASLSGFCRVGLTIILQSKGKYVWESVACIWARWTDTGRYLHYVVRAISILVFIQITLLIVAFFDFLLSLQLTLLSLDPLLFVAFGFGCLACLFTIVLVCYFAFLLFYKQRLRQRRLGEKRPISDGGIRQNSKTEMSSDALEAFYSIVRSSHDDSVLEFAASAMRQIVSHHACIDNTPNWSSPTQPMTQRFTVALRRFIFRLRFRSGPPSTRIELDRLLGTGPGRNGSRHILDSDSNNDRTVFWNQENLAKTVSYLLSTDSSLRASITVASALLSLPDVQFRSLWRSEKGLSARALIELLERMIFSHGHRGVYETDVIALLNRAFRTEYIVLMPATITQPSELPPFARLATPPSHIVDGRTFSLFWTASCYESHGVGEDLARKIKNLTFSILKAVDQADCKGRPFERFSHQQNLTLPSDPGWLLDMFIRMTANEESSDFVLNPWTIQQFHWQTFSFAVHRAVHLAQGGDVGSVNHVCQLISVFDNKLNKLKFHPDRPYDRQLLCRLISLADVLNCAFISCEMLVDVLDMREPDFPDPIPPLFNIQLRLLETLNAHNTWELDQPFGMFRPCKFFIDSVFRCLKKLTRSTYEIKLKCTQFSHRMSHYYELQYRSEKRNPVASTVAARYSFDNICRIARLLEVYPNMAMYSALPEWVKNPKDHVLIYPLRPGWAREYQMDDGVVVLPTLKNNTLSEEPCPFASEQLPPQISYTTSTFKEASAARKNELKSALHALIHAVEFRQMARVQRKSRQEIEEYQAAFLSGKA